MGTIKAKQNQTLFDIALQEYGSIEGVFWIVEDNGLNGILDTLEIGQELEVRDTPINSIMRDYLRSYTIATADGVRGKGIGFWKIKKDFVVS